MAGKRAKAERTSWLVPVIVFGVVMALGVGTGAAAMLWSNDDDEPLNTAEADTTEAAQTTGEPVVAGAAAPDPVVACRGALAAADAAVAAARTGVEHWSGHVQARTDWLAGKISKEEQKRIFEETRAPGPEDVRIFRERAESYQAQAEACGALEPETTPQLSACVARSKTAQGAVEAARKVMGDWEAHLSNKADFREGDFDATHAEHLWLQSWETAPVNIDEFRAADEALQNAPACDV